MRPSAFLAARRGDGSPSLPFPLPPRDAPHRGSVLSGCSLPFWFSAQLHCTRLREFLFFKRQSDSDLPSTACCIGLVFIAAIVLGRLWRRFIGVAASAPLFVLFNILLLWGVYVFVIRRETSSLLDMLINAECALLLWGFYRILSGDPGIVACDSSYLEEAGCKDFVEAIYSSEKLPMLSRVRQCTWCKANIRGYDHHCPAFGTCIGQKNHRLFMALLTGFVVAESTYTMCSTKYITRCISSGTIRSEVSMPISYSLCMNCKAILFGKCMSVPLSQLVFRFLPVFSEPFTWMK
ncbi:Palmitoyltransferase AKR1 [Zea mays]|uniref:S-acyltransferase n=1 Tax=Zea mays TaxID=4577 RepID=A0A1D6JY36_MAIZE|nr:Palmitoyltransferase AKR1 [Zea mays]